MHLADQLTVPFTTPRLNRKKCSDKGETWKSSILSGTQGCWVEVFHWVGKEDRETVMTGVIGKKRESKKVFQQAINPIMLTFIPSSSIGAFDLG